MNEYLCLRVFHKKMNEYPFFEVSMSNYHIKIKVEISKTEDYITRTPTPLSDGSFGIVISEKQGQSIDQCEKALLSTNFPAIRASLSRHFSEVSEEEAHTGGNFSGFVKKTRQPTQ